MSPVMIGLAGIGLLLVLLAFRMQIGFAMVLVGFVGFSALVSVKSSFSLLGMEPFKTAASYGLTVIPLFILMGQFANYSRMGAELYLAVYRWIGFLPGGLAMATIGACAGFAAICGSSLATAATLGMVALPEMKRFKYDDALATGALAAGGTLGILIPPSTVMIIYGILTEQPIATLFIAGIVPGVLLSLLFVLTIYIMTSIKPSLGPPGPSATTSEKFRALRDTWGMLLLFVLVIGGLYAGWFTPTEAGGVGAAGALAVTLVKGRFSAKNLIGALTETTRTTAMVFAILIGAALFGYFIAVSRIPDSLYGWVAALGLNRYIVMIILILLYMLLGCFMEGIAIMVFTLPIVFPTVVRMGFDPIWFGVMITLVMEMSLITPPVGINVFIISGIARDVPMYTIFRGVLPFFIAMAVCCGLLLVFPELALFLPGTMQR